MTLAVSILILSKNNDKPKSNLHLFPLNVSKSALAFIIISLEKLNFFLCIKISSFI